MLKTMVLVSHVNNLTDARYAAGMGVEYLGFALNPTLPDYIAAEQMKGIADWLAGVKIVANTGNATANEAEIMLEGHLVDGLMTQQIAAASAAKTKGSDVFFLVENTDLQNISLIIKTLEEAASQVTYFVLENESKIGHTLSAEELTALQALSQKFPIILGFGFEANTISNILENTTLAGIALRGGQEIRPGFKDLSELADILELLEVED